MYLRDGLAMGRKTAGYLGILGALLIWTGWMVSTRFAHQTSLSGEGLTALRYLVAGGVLLPIAFMKLGRRLLSWKLLVLSALMGSPYMLLVAWGIKTSEAAHTAALLNGSMVLSSTLFGAALLNTKVSKLAVAGLGLILLGSGYQTNFHIFTQGEWFIASAGAIWALYSVLLQKWNVKAWDAIVAVNFWSMLVYALPYLAFHTHEFASTDVKSLVFHGIFQGILTSILAHYFFAIAIKNLGAVSSGLFVPLVPVLTGVIAFFALNETLSAEAWTGILFVSLGIFLSKLRTDHFSKLAGRFRFQDFLQSFESARPIVSSPCFQLHK